MNPAPRLFIDHPSLSDDYGSDQTKSHIRPLSGISLILSI